jgi:5-methylcytosine-specific restriction protein A
MISSAEPAAIKQALARFDQDLRATPEWASWTENKAHKYAIKVQGRLYPVKQILSLATGTPVADFSGGEGSGQANSVVRELGFEIVALRGRNPKWTRDELILALDFYLRHRPNPPGKETDEIRDLSEALNRLADSLRISPGGTYRNANAVYMKLMNFRRLDPGYTGEGKVGLTRGGKEDEAVWAEFAPDPSRCHAAAQAIRETTKAAQGTPVASLDEDTDDGAEAEEGRLLTALHRRRERNRKIVEKKKQQALRQGGILACEVCGFDFRVAYGERGEGFIECHHTKPVSESAGQKTRLTDLALVCANCHRMIHARRPWLSIDELRALLRR